MAYLIAVDSGHGMETAGKRTPPLPQDLVIGSKTVRKKGEVIHEKEWNRAAADSLMAALQRCGMKTIDVSPGTADISLQKRVDAANGAKADLFISKHYNASQSKWWTPGYTVTFISRSASDASKKLGKAVQDEIAKATGWKSEGVQTDYSYMGIDVKVLKDTNMPAILTETGFMDVWEHAKKMLDPDFVKAEAEATCKGICSYLNVKYVAPGVDEGKLPEGQVYALQLGAYAYHKNALEALEKAKANGYKDAYLIKKDTTKKTYVEGV